MKMRLLAALVPTLLGLLVAALAATGQQENHRIYIAGHRALCGASGRLGAHSSHRHHPPKPVARRGRDCAGAHQPPGGRDRGTGHGDDPGREIPRRVLVLEAKDKSVFLGDQFDHPELYSQLDDGLGAQIDYEVIEIPESVQSAMDPILGSLTRNGELPSSRPDILTCENTLYGFSFQYPAPWTVEEVEGETVETGAQMSKLADSVILRNGGFAIVVQYLRKSDPDQVAWSGRHRPADLFFGDAVLGDKVTVMGLETDKRIWTYNDGIKAVFVVVVADVADLVLHITLGDNTRVSNRDLRRRRSLNRRWQHWTRS